MPIAQASISNSNTTILTVTSGQRWNVYLTFANYHATTSETLTVYVVPSGSSAGNSTTFLKSWVIAAGRTLVIDEPLHLVAGDSIIAVGSTGSLVTATASYSAEG